MMVDEMSLVFPVDPCWTWTHCLLRVLQNHQLHLLHGEVKICIIFFFSFGRSDIIVPCSYSSSKHSK